MASSQNGWAVATREQQDRAPLIRDVVVPNGVLAGDVAVVFRWLAQEYDRRVERLKAGTCWGWFVKPIEGSRTISNHASGTAVDFNASDNPMGVPTKQFMSAKQITECRAIVRESGGVLRWGGDYTGRPDAMHWEIVGTRAQVAALASRIKQNQMEDDDVALTDAQTRKAIREELDAWGKRDPIATIYARSGEQRDRMASLIRDVAGLDSATVDIDEDALAAKIAEAIPAEIADAVLDKLRSRLAA